VSLHHNPTYRALPPDLQAQVTVALTLGAQAAAIRKLTDEIRRVLEMAAPEFAAFGEALDHHVRALEQYFASTLDHAYGAGWRRG
jgi:hypothetical protein